MKKLYQGLVLCVFSSSVSSAGVIPTAYDIYIGDINNDGLLDYYFHGKSAAPTTDENSAFLAPSNAPQSYVIYRYGDEYLSAVEFSLTHEQVFQLLEEGLLRQATLSDEALNGPEDLVYLQSANGAVQFLLREPGGSLFNALLALGGDTPPAITAYIYTSGEGRHNNINSSPNSDASKNPAIILATNVIAADLGMEEQIATASYATAQNTATPITLTYSYDQLGRLERVESTNGDQQYYGLDAEDNRSSHTDTLSTN